MNYSGCKFGRRHINRVLNWSCLPLAHAVVWRLSQSDSRHLGRALSSVLAEQSSVQWKRCWQSCVRFFPFPPGRERCRRWVQPLFICLAMGLSAAQLVQRAGWHIWNAPTCRNTSAFREAKCALINACLCASIFTFAAQLTGWQESQRPNAISTFRSMLIARLGNWTTVLVCDGAKREICFSTKVCLILLW